ncbi:MAG: hypothetical protein U9Q76_07720 [candidate division WOR-3 bacterium]|nr:hypothetical protein [candidate division WOR-3 bacterium]
MTFKEIIQQWGPSGLACFAAIITIIIQALRSNIVEGFRKDLTSSFHKSIKTFKESLGEANGIIFEQVKNTNVAMFRLTGEIHEIKGIVEKSTATIQILAEEIRKES